MIPLPYTERECLIAEARRARDRRALAEERRILDKLRLLTLWLLATLCFVLLRAAPGGPFDAEKAAPPEVEAALAAQYRLDQPLLRNFGSEVNLAAVRIARNDERRSIQELRSDLLDVVGRAGEAEPHEP